jgi:hypothetical protein
MLAFVFLGGPLSVSAGEQPVELSAGAGIYFPRAGEFSQFFEGQPAAFSFQLGLPGKSGFDFKLTGDYLTKSRSQPAGRDLFVHLYDLRVGVGFRMLRQRPLTPFVGGGATVSEVRGGEKPGADLKARALGGYVEGGVRYRVTSSLFAAFEVWQDFRKGKAEGIGLFSSFQADSSTSLGGTHVGLRLGVRLGK